MRERPSIRFVVYPVVRTRLAREERARSLIFRAIHKKPTNLGVISSSSQQFYAK